MMSRTMIVAILILIGLVAPKMALAQHQAAFEQGNELFRTQQYEKAVAQYGSLIQQGVHDAVLYYNAGCALAAMKENGRAAAMFERALKLRPNWDKAQRNLERVRPAPPRTQSAFILVPLEWVFGLFAAREFFAATVVLFWLFALAAMAWVLMSGRGRGRRVAGIAACVLLAGTTVAWCFFAARREREQWVEAVALKNGTVSRNGPSEKTLEQDVLSAGVKMRCLESPRDGWIKVQLPNGHTGYVAEDKVEVL